MKFHSARQAIHDAYAIHLTSKGFDVNPVAFRSGGKSNKLDNNRLICNAVEAGMVIAAVEKLEEPFRSWAIWAYGPRTKHFLPEQGRFFQWLEQDVTERLAKSERDYREATEQRIRDVVAYTVLDYRSYAANGRHLYSTSLVINKCRIHRQNWKRDFLSWHEYYWQFCDHNLDRTSLLSASESVRKLKSDT
ncbi:bacteriophage antitermination protein Q [uncultured Endozoicomonas sp.]|uniref:bacteriophage antitermination protein Q n=1 Tax=uncultured Endozoicomonas sp. TaxID=432652 RepID=UPI00261273D0|nr:bacteriophage antitermination protein Q [uncultured Endozoicomonas sp.]